MSEPAGKRRIASIDLLRGGVMILMALDHARDFIADGSADPTDLTRSWPALFFTRWITHFSAPVFIFLAGVSAFLHGSLGRTTGALSRFLFTRGIWIVLLELTVVRFGWTFDASYGLIPLQVMWAIGWSMVALSGLVRLPLKATGGVAVAMICGHDLLNGVHADALGRWGAVWAVVHEQHFFRLEGGRTVGIIYPLVPWIGVMALGYVCGPWFIAKEGERRRRLLRAGWGLVFAFIVLRLQNRYGDPHPWAVGKDSLYTIMSFLNCSKYPPSLLYLFMTLGPALLALAFLERAWNRRISATLAGAVATYGRVPLFYYVIHIFLIRAVALVMYRAKHGSVTLTHSFFAEGNGYGLTTAYIVWICAVLSLYPACAWFARLKARRRDAWLSYL